MSTELLYFANPFCSWCWGFAPVLDRLKTERPDLRYTVVTGELGVNDKGPLSAKARRVIGEHWQHVHEMSGQFFDHTVLEKPELTYDTKPACQTLMLVRKTYPALAHAFLSRIAERFFTQGHDISDPAILSDAVSEFGMGRSIVKDALSDPATLEEMHAEWRQTVSLGVTGYPTLLCLASGKAEVITIGWCDAPTILERL